MGLSPSTSVHHSTKMATFSMLLAVFWGCRGGGRAAGIQEIPVFKRNKLIKLLANSDITCYIHTADVGRPV